MKVLVIGDIHGRKFWREAINNNVDKVDKVVFLGDYLDPYHNEIDDNPKSMECKYFNDYENLLKMLEEIFSLKKTNPNKYILLTGNHTDSYIWENFSLASRTDFKNWKLYHNFFLENLNLFNFVWIENDVIFSHAGISEKWANEFLYNYMKYDDEAELQNNSAILETAIVLRDTPLENFNNFYIKAISCISRYRGGDYFNGSCEWADLREHIDIEKSINRIIPKGEDEIYQVFGHTQIRVPIITDKWACLDCRQSFIIDTISHEISEY